MNETRIALILASFAMVIALLANGAGYRANQIALDKIEDATKVNCQKIELVNLRVRQNANKSYKELDQNAKLLKIEVTPELRAKSKKNRDETLRRYAAREC